MYKDFRGNALIKPYYRQTRETLITCQMYEPCQSTMWYEYWPQPRLTLEQSLLNVDKLFGTHNIPAALKYTALFWSTVGFMSETGNSILFRSL